MARITVHYDHVGALRTAEVDDPTLSLSAVKAQLTEVVAEFALLKSDPDGN